MLYWGEEFFDDGLFGKQVQSQDYEGYRSGGIMIPISLLSEIVDPKYIKEIKVKDSEKIQYLQRHLSLVGQLQPGHLVYDRQYIRLKEGNHRYIAAQNLGWSHMRVTMRRVESIATYGLPLCQVVPRLLEVAYEI